MRDSPTHDAPTPGLADNNRTQNTFQRSTTVTTNSPARAVICSLHPTANPNCSSHSPRKRTLGMRWLCGRPGSAS